MHSDQLNEKYSLILFWLVTIHLAIISISIAAASILLFLSYVLIITWSIQNRKFIFPKTSLDYFFLAYFIIHILTTITAIYPMQAFVNSKRLLLIGVIYMFVLSMNSRERIYKFITILAGVISVLSIVEITFYFYEHFDRLFLFQHYMTTGGLKMITCLLLIPFILDKHEIRKTRITFALFLVPIFLALILTNTRSSWLGFLAGTIILSILYYRKLFTGIIVIVIAFFLFAPKTQVDRAKSIIDLTHPSNYGRINMWSTGFKIFKDYPLLGVGDSDLADIYVRYKSFDDVETGGHLHNNFVMLLVIHGIIGFGIVMILWGKIISQEYSIFKKWKSDVLIRNVALGSVIIFVGFMVNGMFEWNFGDHEIMVFVWGSVGFALSVEQIGMKEAS